MPEYRRRKGRDTWHWCRNCSNWPTSNYVSRQSKPTNVEGKRKRVIVRNS